MVNETIKTGKREMNNWQLTDNRLIIDQNVKYKI